MCLNNGEELLGEWVALENHRTIVKYTLYKIHKGQKVTVVEQRDLKRLVYIRLSPKVAMWRPKDYLVKNFIRIEAVAPKPKEAIPPKLKKPIAPLISNPLAPTFEFEIGDLVKDKITEFVGVVTSRTQLINNCNTYEVQSRELKDGVPQDPQHFDQAQLQAIFKGLHIFCQEKGGPVRSVDR